jgi:hypothetical protein
MWDGGAHGRLRKLDRHQKTSSLEREAEVPEAAGGQQGGIIVGGQAAFLPLLIQCS